jgi:hypothetical protein
MNEFDEDDLKAWIDALIAATVKELTDRRVVGGALIEAKPAWCFPFRLLIGKIREQGEVTSYSWFISGDMPTAIADSSVAATPREAARYFALRWQLNSARRDDGFEEMAADAEQLYQLVSRDELWQD